MVHDPGEAGAPEPEPASSSEDALAIWREKLDFFSAEHAKIADRAQKYELRKLIEEAEREIAKLEGASSPASTASTSRAPYPRLAAALLLLVVLVLIVLVALRPSPKVEVNVFVVDARNRPLPGLEVWAKLPDGARTDAAEQDGYYVLEVSNGASMQVCAKGETYPERCSPTYLIAPDMPRIEIKLQGTGP